MKRLIAVLGLLLMIFVSACAQQEMVNDNLEDRQVTEQTGEGRVVFAVTDAAADMGTVTSIMITVDSVSVHSEGEGWVTVSSTQKTYDLLELKAEGKQELLIDVELDEGTYNEMRLDVSSVVVTDANGTHEAKLPSNELKIKSDLVVEGNSTSTVTFDFIADESLHMTGNGKYIMAPVVQVETREDAAVDVEADNEVKIKSGRVSSKIKVGMDAQGNVGVGLGIPANANVTIDMSGMLKIGGKSEAKAKTGVGVSVG